MNSYEEKQEARRARYEEKASRLRDEAHRLHDQAHEMASAIPFGQPILVGHHSEGRDRRYRDRIHNTFGKAFATMDKADYYEEKAARSGAAASPVMILMPWTSSMTSWRTCGGTTSS